MSKRHRYHATGRMCRNYDGTITTSPFPGAKTQEDVGRQILHNRGKAQRARVDWLPARVRPQVRAWLRRLRKSCLGGEFKRLLDKNPVTSEQFAQLRARRPGGRGHRKSRKLDKLKYFFREPLK